MKGEIADRVHGLDAADQAAVDRAMIELDGTPNKARLGANAILGVSLAAAKAAAAEAGLPLWRYLGGEAAHVLPVPMMNVLNGGAHADNKVDFQEFMVVPVGAATFGEALRTGAEVFHALRGTLHERGLATAVGDEGGFAPDLESNEAALEALVSGIEAAGYRPGETWASRSTRPPASSPGTAPTCWSTRAARSPRSELAAYWEDLASRYPILSDRGRHGRGGLGRVEGAHRPRSATACSSSGDDLFVTNTERLRRGIDSGVANSILVKVNQIGTLTETLDAVRIATRGRLHGRDVAPLGRDRGHHDRRPRRGHRLRADQDGRSLALGSRGEVQPAPAHRGGAGGGRHLSRPVRIPVARRMAAEESGRRPQKDCPNGLLRSPQHGRAAPWGSAGTG